jgi:hypothetical protein
LKSQHSFQYLNGLTQIYLQKYPFFLVYGIQIQKGMKTEPMRLFIFKIFSLWGGNGYNIQEINNPKKQDFINGN